MREFFFTFIWLYSLTNNTEWKHELIQNTGHVEAVEALIVYGANLNAKDSNG